MDEAENIYRDIIRLQPKEIGGYCKLWNLMEAQGRLLEAEDVIKLFEDSNHYSGLAQLVAFYKRQIERSPDEAVWPYKLGMVLYPEAFKPSLDNFLDTIVCFPLRNETVFIDLDLHNKIFRDSSFSLDKNLFPGMTALPEVTAAGESTHIGLLPGTNEAITYAGSPIHTPRMNAIKYLVKAASMIKSPDLLADINFKIGNVYVRAGSKKQAFPYYNEAILFDTTNANYRLNMIDVAGSLYRNGTALDNLEYLYQQKQINFPNRLLLAEFEIHAGNFSEAKKILDEARFIHPYDIPAIDDLNGRMYLLSKNAKQSIVFYKTYLNKNAGDPMTIYSIARAYALSGNDADAWNWLETSIKDGFNYSWVLKYDEVWNKYRRDPRWEQIMRRWLKRKVYPSERGKM